MEKSVTGDLLILEDGDIFAKCNVLVQIQVVKIKTINASSIYKLINSNVGGEVCKLWFTLL